jgi:hypothetical protein
LPLAGSGTCTIREAVIFSSVINRCSLPVLHSAAALLRLAQMTYSGVTSYFIRILLDKKYALPLKVCGVQGVTKTCQAARDGFGFKGFEGSVGVQRRHQLLHFDTAGQELCTASQGVPGCRVQGVQGTWFRMQGVINPC